MADSFDPYHKWLGIKPKDQPANHYRLLGVELFETDQDVIQNAADQRMRHVRSFQSGVNAEVSQRLLNELAAARACLADSQRRQGYDLQLRETTAPPLQHAVPPPAYSRVPPEDNSPAPVDVVVVPLAAPPAPPPRPTAAPATPRPAVGQSRAGMRTGRPRAGEKSNRSLAMPITIAAGVVVVFFIGVAFIIASRQQQPSAVTLGGTETSTDAPSTTGGRPPINIEPKKPVKPPKTPHKPKRPDPVGQLKLDSIGNVSLQPGEHVHLQLKLHDPDQWKGFAWFALGPGVPNDTRIDPETGLVQWAPPPNAIKAYDFSVEAHWNNQVDSSRFRVELPWARGELVFDAPGSHAVAVGQTLNVPFKLHDDLGAARGVKFHVSSESKGASVDDARGQFTWHPDATDVDKTHSFTISATDDRGATATQYVSVKVVPGEKKAEK